MGFLTELIHENNQSTLDTHSINDTPINTPINKNTTINEDLREIIQENNQTTHNTNSTQDTAVNIPTNTNISTPTAKTKLPTQKIKKIKRKVSTKPINNTKITQFFHKSTKLN